MNTSRRDRAARAQEPAPAGNFYEPIKEPEAVGSISASEATELRTLAKMHERAVEDARHAAVVADLFQNQRQSFAKQLVERQGLEMADLYSVSDATGAITRTHRWIPAPLEIIEGTEKET